MLLEIRIFPGYMNILLAGRSGARKSAFINSKIEKRKIFKKENT